MTTSPGFEFPPGRPLRVLIVCLGNICRSPMAAAVFRDRLDRAGLSPRVEVDSAGTGSWHVGQGADPRAAATLERHGYDDAHVARQIARADLVVFDLVLVADRSNLADVEDLVGGSEEAAEIRLVRSFDPDAPEGAEIPDPYYGGEHGFDDALALIEAAADGFVEAVQAAGGAAR